MAPQHNQYSALKKSLDTVIQSFKQIENFLEDWSISDLQRDKKCVAEILEDVDHAICERQYCTNNLDKLIEDARIHQKRGDIYHGKKLYIKALNEYSKSLCSLPYNFHMKIRVSQDADSSYCSESITMNCNRENTRSSDMTAEGLADLISKSLAGRAEMLRIVGHHELALKDIKEALSLRPNKETKSSVMQTHKLCLSEMRRQQRSQSPKRSPSVASAKHASIHSASSLVKINYNKDKGRHLEANGNIKAGDVLIVEKPFASILLPEFYHSHCYHCMKQLVAPIPCFTCQDVLFCSKECQEKAYTSYHNIECKIWPLIQMVDSFGHLSVRIILTAKPEELLSTLEAEKTLDCNIDSIHGYTNKEYKNNYKAIYNLVTNSDLHSKTSVISTNLVSSIIGRYLASPSAVTPVGVRPWNHSTSQSIPSLRLSSSSPALLDGRQYSNENLNSLADAFANSSLKEARSCEDKLFADLSVADPSEPLRRLSAPLDIMKDLSGMKYRRHSCCESEDNLSSGFYQSVLTEKQIQKLISRHLQQVACNVHTVTRLVLVEDEETESQPKDEVLFGKQERSFRKEQRQIAIGLYPTASLLNHACDPDVIVSFIDDELVMRATHKISQGEEITHCYVPHVGRMQRAARQRMLQKRYFFVCSCASCRRDEERERRQFLSLQLQCQECRDHAKVNFVNDSYVATCSNKDCGRVVNIETQLEQIQYSKELFLDAVDAFKSGDVKKSLTTLRLVMKKRSSLLQSKDRLVAEVHDALSRCYEVLREWEFASYHCSLNLDSVEQQYGDRSAECAHAVVKLARFLFNGKMFDKAGKVIDRGIRLLSMHHGEDFPVLRELKKMKECVKNFSTPVTQFSL